MMMTTFGLSGEAAMASNEVNVALIQTSRATDFMFKPEQKGVEAVPQAWEARCVDLDL